MPAFACEPFGYSRRIRTDRCGICLHPRHNVSRFCCGMGCDGIENVGSGNRAAERNSRVPRYPVAPHRQRRKNLGVLDPSGSAVNRSTTDLFGKKAGELREREGHKKAHHHRYAPDHKSDVTRCSCDASNRKQTSAGTTTSDPKSPCPIDGRCSSFELSCARGASTGPITPSPVAKATALRICEPDQRPSGDGYTTRLLTEIKGEMRELSQESSLHLRKCDMIIRERDLRIFGCASSSRVNARCVDKALHTPSTALGQHQTFQFSGGLLLRVTSEPRNSSH